MSVDAATLKEDGNALFREQKYEEASAKYSEALDATSDGVARAVLYSNRAQCFLSLKRWEDAKFDAAEALLADPNNHKSWHRLGRAYVGLDFHMKGIQVFEFAARITQDSGLASTLWQASRDAKKAAKTAGKNEPTPPTPSAEHVARGARLKDEGNAFVSAQPPDYNAAYARFTLALVFDPLSAIIHCNRAYCSNSLKEWDAAELDARLATSLDEGYAKAWARLGAAKLGQRKVAEGEDAFKRALKLLNDKGNLSSADARLKASIEQSLEDARGTTRVVKGVQVDQTQMPWTLANQVLKLNFDPSDRATWYSSAWVIAAAHSEFVGGCQQLYATQRVGIVSMGTTGALESITNGLISDSRSFFIDRPDFFERYKAQVAHEATACKGFKEQGADALFHAVKARLRSEGGWGPHTVRAPVRKSLAVTIRAWFLNAFLRVKLMQDFDKALELYKHVVDFLELGRAEWATTPRDERGVIFEPTFLLGVRRCYAECMKERDLANVRLGVPVSVELLERMKANAESMLEEAATFSQADRVPTVTGMRKPSFVLPFIFYPEALAYEDLGFYWYRKAKHGTGGDRAALKSYLGNSIDAYARAVEIYPPDEEMRAEALWHRLVSMFRCGRPLSETLPVCDELEQAVKDKQKIWRGSPNADGGKTDRRYQSFVWFAEDAREAVGKGQFTMESPAMPDAMNTIIE